MRVESNIKGDSATGEPSQATFRCGKVNLLVPFYFLLVLGFASLLFFGAINIALLDQVTQSKINEYNAAVRAWPPHAALLNGTNFEMTWSNESHHFRRYSFNVSSVGPGANAYSGLQLRQNVSFLSLVDVLPPFDPPAALFTLHQQSSDLLKIVNVSLYQREFTAVSAASHHLRIKSCIESGHFYWEANNVCVAFRVLKTVESVVSRMQGDFMPQDLRVHYEPVNYSAIIHLKPISLSIVDSHDPSLLLDKLTDGLGSFSFVRANHFKIFAAFVFIGGVALVLSIALGVFRVCLSKRGSLVTEKNSVQYSAIALRLTFVGCIAALVAAFGMTFGFLQHWSWQPLFQWPGMVGVILSFSFLPFSICLFVLGSNVCLERFPAGAWRTATLLTGAFSCLVIAVYSFVGLAAPWEVAGVTAENEDPLSRMLGIMLLAVFVGYGVALLLLAATTINCPSDSATSIQIDELSSDSFPLMSRSRPSQRSYDYLYYVLVFGIVLPLCFLGAAFLPPIWNVPLETYFTMKSPFSVAYLPIGEPLSKCVPEAVAQVASHHCMGGTPTCHINAKIYPDVLIYFAYVYFIGLIGIVCSVSVRFKRFLQRPVGRSSVGEITFLFSFVVMFILWLAYWAFWYCRIASGGVTKTWQETVGRVMGQGSNMLLAGLTWPTTRTGVIQRLFGIPFERAIKYHRWAATLWYFLVILHATFFSWVWVLKSTFFENLFALHYDPHPDNFTVLMMQIAVFFVLIPHAVFTFNTVRRKQFELFFYSHHLFLAIYLISLIHAWGLPWMLAPPLILYALERFLRFYQQHKYGSRRAKFSKGPDATTKISVDLRLQRFRAGQYCFINIPSISILQWHPFSVTSTNTSQLTFLVKNMGPHTFTDSIESLAAHELDSTVMVDGPYGCPPWLPGYSSVILVAGGIGVTPILSLVGQYYNHPDLRVVCVAKSQEFLTYIAEDLGSHISSGQIFLYCTGDAGEHHDDHITLGRPNLAQFIKRSSFVFACGPQGLTEHARQVATEKDARFHMETFLL